MERSRPSVRQEMKEIREEQRQRTSSAQKSKDEPNRTSEHRPVPKKKKDKERCNVIINDDRWNSGTDVWMSGGGDLARYRTMVINHE